MRELVEELVAHCVDLRRQLTRELKDPHRAEDITQSSFERVYVQTLEAEQMLAAGIESPRALLFRVARNLCISEARHHKVAREWSNQRASGDTPQSAPSCEHIHAQRQVIMRVVEVLEALPPLRREVFLLYRAYGFDRAEIAQRLKLSEAAVAKHLVRAAVDCSKVFAELRAQLIEPQAVSGRTGVFPTLAEDLP